TPPIGTAGTYAASVMVLDGYHQASVSFTWTIRTNQPPVVGTIANQTNAETFAISPITVTATDPDNDPVTFSATGLPPGVTISAAGVISGTVAPGSAGSYSPIVTASDGKLTGTRTFTWTVTRWATFPVKASANGRYLVDQNNVPFMMQG